MAIKKDIDLNILPNRTSPISIEMVGKKYGKLTVICFIGVHKSDTGNTMAIVRAKCDCGSLHNYQSRHLREGRSISCGCFQAAFSSVKHTKHGQKATMYGNRGTVLYSRWRSMFDRVKSNPSYSHVIIAERWCGNRGFENFVKDMGPMPTPKHTVDRYPISNGNYVPENTRWATSKQQGQNTVRNRNFEYNGEFLCLSEIARRNNIRPRELGRRINNLKLSLSDALKYVPRKLKTKVCIQTKTF